MLGGIRETDHLAKLSGREALVARKFAKGLTYRQVSEALSISPTTVRTHLAAIYQKLGIRNKAALVSFFADLRSNTERGAVVDREGRLPVIAVLPVKNLSGSEHWSRLAEGLSADLIAELAPHRDLSVISRHAIRSFRGHMSDTRFVGRELHADYLLEGSLQAFGGRVRIAVQLIDSSTGVSLWSERFDEAASDFFAVQDRVTHHVVNGLAGCFGKLASLGRDIARRKPQANLKAYDCYLLGVELHDRSTSGSRTDTIRMLSRAAELDPGFARAWGMLGVAHSVDACNAFTSDPASSVRQWRKCIEKALLLDPADPLARILMGNLRAIDSDIAGAGEEHDRALALAPNDADTLAMLASRRALVCGNPEEGCALAERALRLNRQAPGWYYAQLACARFVAGRDGDCLSTLRQAPPDTPATLMFVVLAHALLDDMASAGAAARRMAEEFPGFTVGNFIRTYPVTNPPALAAIREAARLAGIS